MTDVMEPGTARWNGHSADLDLDLVADLHEKIGAALAEARRTTGDRPLEDERADARRLLSEELRRRTEKGYATGQLPLSGAMQRAVAAAVMDCLYGLAGFQPYLDDPNVQKLRVSGCDRVWVTTRDGKKVRGRQIARSDSELIEVIQTGARRFGLSERRWDNANPALNLRLPNGDRLHALMAVCGRPMVTIRRHDFSIARLSQLVELGMCDGRLAAFLTAAVRARLSIIVAGGTDTGKTTFMRCLINEIPAEEHLITIEDSLELGLEHFDDLHPDYDQLEARPPNTEGEGEVTLASLVRESLRDDPDRVFVGEVRGGEVIPMLLAMSQGNEGSMCTVHAQDSKAVFDRLITYGLLAPERFPERVTTNLINHAVNLVVHLGWDGTTRRVTSVREIVGSLEPGEISTNELWRLGPSGKAVPGSTPSVRLREALERHGFDPATLLDQGARL